MRFSKLSIVILFCSIFEFQTDYTSLKSCLRSKKSTAEVITRRDVTFNETNFQFIFDNQIQPLGFILVQSKKDVVKTVKCGRILNLHFTIRGGGHSYAKYSFGSNHSWIIDVSGLNKIKFNYRTKIVTVDSGLKLTDINNQLWKKFRYGVVSGTCGAVGVSGFSMGGGFGYHMRKYGLAVDQIVGIKMVTANGNVIKVNKNRNADLFWAIRGAGAAGFGVVTELKLKTFPAFSTFVWANLKYSLNNFSIVLIRWQQILKFRNCSTIGFRINRKVINQTSDSADNVMFTFVITDYRGENEQFETLKTFLPNVTDNDIKRGTYLEMLKDIDGKWSNCTSFLRQKSWFVSRYLSEKEIEMFVDLVRDRIYAGFAIEPCPSPESQPMRTETAYVHRDCVFMVKIRYYLKACDANTINNAILLDNEYYKGLNELANLLSFMDNGESYQNYEDDDLIEWRKRYYAENYDRLKMIKTKFDPINFFRFNHSISPM
ncbi:FAD-linked oxidase-like protein [Leptotrombidium deliense]|uniref:FAD-linked oxidase-like protein n=1 Tax=Leptotrombidium deliense TaxID=299467 RepID=A0A443S474_9ACAR|nr:FAD-linked oxidase-like protein [Leptotrombidium deliense]